METAVVCSISIAATGTIAITCFSHLRMCVAGTVKTIRDFPALHRDAFTHPINQLVASQRSAPPLGAHVNCKIGDKPMEMLYVVFNGEVLLAGPDANAEEVAFGLGGTTVSSTGSTVSLDGKYIDRVALDFTNEKEAKTWVRELQKASSTSPPGKRIDELIAGVFFQEQQIADLQEELCRLRRIERCAELTAKQKADEKRIKETVKDLEEQLEAQVHKAHKHRQKAKLIKKQVKGATPTSIYSSLASIQDLLDDLEGRGTPVARCREAVNGVVHDVKDDQDLNLQLVEAHTKCREFEEKVVMLEKHIESLMANEVPDSAAEMEQYKSKAAEFEAMVMLRDEELRELRAAVSQMEADTVQLMEYRELLQEKERELLMVTNTRTNGKQEEVAVPFHCQMAQYEVALQLKEQELEAARKGSGHEVQMPSVDKELLLLRERVAQYEQIHEQRKQDVMQLQGEIVQYQQQVAQYEQGHEQRNQDVMQLQDEIMQYQKQVAQYEQLHEQHNQDVRQLQDEIVQHQSALQTKERDIEMMRTAPMTQQDELALQLKDQIAQYETALQQKDQQLQATVEMQKQIAQYEAALQQKERECETIADLQNKVAQHEVILQQKEQTLQEALSAVSQSMQPPSPQDDIMKLREQVAQYEQVHQQHTQDVVQLQSQILQYEDALKERQHDVETLCNTRLEQDELTRQLQNQVTQYEAIIAEKEKQLVEKMSEADKTRGGESMALLERAEKETQRANALEREVQLVSADSQQWHQRAAELQVMLTDGAERIANLENQLERVAQEGGANQGTAVSRALEAESQLVESTRKHEQEKTQLRDQLTQQFEKDLAQLRAEAARLETDAHKTASEATVVAQEHAALLAKRDQEVQHLSEHVSAVSSEKQQLAQQNAELETRLRDVLAENRSLAEKLVQMEQKEEALVKESDTQEHAAQVEQLYQDVADLKSQVTRKTKEADEFSRKAKTAAQERDVASKQMAELQSIYNQRLADVNRHMAKMVNPEELLAVKQQLATREAFSATAEAKWKQAEQHRQSAEEKIRSLEAELASARERAAAGDEMAKHVVRLQSERDMLQHKLNQQVDNDDKELQELQVKSAQCDASYNTSLQTGSFSGSTSPGATQNLSRTPNSQNNLAVTWSQINEQTRRIEEERLLYWKELEQARGRPIATLATVGCRACAPATSAQAALSVPSVSAPTVPSITRTPGFVTGTQSMSVQISTKPNGVQLMRPLSPVVLQGETQRHQGSSPLSAAATQGVATTSTLNGSLGSVRSQSPPLISSRRTGAATMDAASPSSTTVPYVSDATPNLRPLSHDRVSSIRNFQQPYA